MPGPRSIGRKLTCSQPTTINWKSDDVDLTKKFPRQTDSEDPEDFEGDSGSFFHYFTAATDPFSVGFAVCLEDGADRADRGCAAG